MRAKALAFCIIMIEEILQPVCWAADQNERPSLGSEIDFAVESTGEGKRLQ